MRELAKISWILVATALIGLGNVSTVRADESTVVVARVPFAFIVGDAHLPAGDYTVKKNDLDGTALLSIAKTDGRQLVYAVTFASSRDSSSQPELVFKKFANQYFLARVVPQDGNGREIVLTPSIMEHELLTSGQGLSR
jgi:hypothetical protein